MVIFGVQTQPRQRGSEAAEAQRVGFVTGWKMRLQRLTGVRVLALIGHPALHRRFVGELVERRTVAGDVQQGQPGLAVFQAQQVGGDITVDVQAGDVYAVSARLQAGDLPGQHASGVGEAALADLPVAGGDEIDLGRIAVGLQPVFPVRLEHLLVGLLEVQVPDEALKRFGADAYMVGLVIARRRHLSVKAVVHLIRRAVVEQAVFVQMVDQGDRVGRRIARPGLMQCSADQVVVRLALPVGQQGLSQGELLHDTGNAALPLDLIVQGDGVDLVGIQVQAVLGCPLVHRIGGGAVGSGVRLEGITDGLNALATDEWGSHGGIPLWAREVVPGHDSFGAVGGRGNYVGRRLPGSAANRPQTGRRGGRRRLAPRSGKRPSDPGFTGPSG